MHSTHVVPELALARVVTPGGPYSAGNEISLAFTSPAVARLVAHDATLRDACRPLEHALIPEIVSVVITHAAAPYVAGDVLTLSFVDPRVARVQRSVESLAAHAHAIPRDSDVVVAVPLTGEPPPAARQADLGSAPPPADSSVEGGAQATPQVRVGEAMTLRASALVRPESFVTSEHGARDARTAEYARDAGHPEHARDAGHPEHARDAAHPEHARDAAHPKHARDAGHPEHARDAAHPEHARDAAYVPEFGACNAGSGIAIRLDWSGERLRRFVQVVDRLFTIDRLGWYRHSLAMRLLIPDEIQCGDALANVEAMRHLQALRAAAVEALGKPLLAACMPGFAVTSNWLETVESAREARAIEGLREALVPYANDDEPREMPAVPNSSTFGTIDRISLATENATSVDAFLPLLIATRSHDVALHERLTEYRRLLLDLFAQTARAGEPVRLHQMAQPNHSLDDRLWQLVGAAGEAFGGFARL